MTSKAEGLKVFQKSMDLAVWLLGHTAKFPKSLRFSVAVRMDNAMLDVIECITSANYETNRLPILQRADVRLNNFRILLRLSHQLHLIAPNSYEYGAREVDEIGKLLGGWIRQQKTAGLKRE